MFGIEDCDCDWCGKCRHCHEHVECYKKLDSEESFKRLYSELVALSRMSVEDRAKILSILSENELKREFLIGRANRIAEIRKKYSDLDIKKFAKEDAK